METVFSLLFSLVLMAGCWKVFQKMGRRGWEGIIPGYNLFVLFRELYNNGHKMWFLLIPFYNIYVWIRCNMDLAARFNRAAGFGVGLAFLTPIFTCILGFGKSRYLDGSRAVTGTDPISRFLDSLGNGGKPDSADEIKKYKDLLDSGAITQEEYEEKKRELLGR